MWERFIERWQMLTREQQISVVVLMICGGCAISLSLFRIQASIKEPFLVRKDTLLSAKKLLGPSELQKIEKQQRTDTDGDSLSDWDEVNTYKTNPNLRDSCGDGVSDNVRIATGKSINCTGVATGQPIDTSGLKQDNVLSPINIQAPVSGAAQFGSNSNLGQAAQDPQKFIEQMLPRDPKVIRQLLKGKVSDERLKTISDEDLLKLFDAAMKEQGSIPTESESAPTPAAEDKKTDSVPEQP